MVEIGMITTNDNQRPPLKLTVAFFLHLLVLIEVEGGFVGLSFLTEQSKESI